MRRCTLAMGGAALAMVLASAAGRAGAQTAEGLQPGLKLTGLVGAPLAHGDGGSSRATVEPSLRLKGAGFDLRGELRLRHLDQAEGRRTDLDVRELSAGWRRGAVSLSLGAQQVQWGRMDLLRVTDVVNPVDLHDLFTQELPEAKRPLVMANLEWQAASGTLQVIASPQVAADRLPRRWNGLPLQVERPGDSLAHGTYGARWGFEAAGWNADLVAVHGWRSSPALVPVVDAQGIHLAGRIVRQDSVGFSADKPFGAVVLRVEGLLAQVGAGAAVADAPAAQRHRLAVLGSGIDWRAGPWFVAAQVIAEHASIASGAGAAGGRDIAYLSALVQRKWLQDRLSGRALRLQETRGGSSWTSLQAAYELSPRQVLQLQVDRFAGPQASTFGAFQGRSRVALALRVTY